MTRKLCSLLISSFAVLLLMGAGVEEDSAALVDESGSEAVQTAATQVETEEQAEPVAAVSGESVLSQVEEVDPTLTVDGQPVTADVAKTYRGDTTYVALVPMSKCLDSTVQSKWDAGTRTATVHNDKLVLTAKVGQLYLTVNYRYFYTPEGIQIENGQVMVPLSALVKAFDGSLTWNGTTGVTSVTRERRGQVRGAVLQRRRPVLALPGHLYREREPAPGGENGGGQRGHEPGEAPLFPQHH